MTDYTPTTWARAFLARLGVTQPTSTEVDEAVAWEDTEGGNWKNTARDNPLNTSQVMPGSANYKTGLAGGGVQRYASWESGLDATVKTIQYPAYAGVLSALKQPNNPGGFVSALKASPWDAGHYASGFAPIKGVTYSGATGPNAPTLGGVGSPSNPAGIGAASDSDWIASLNKLLNPSVGGVSWNPFKDASNIGATIELVASRAGFAFLGVILFGGGLLLAFGRDIFGGSVVQIPLASALADSLRDTGTSAASDETKEAA